MGGGFTTLRAGSRVVWGEAEGGVRGMVLLLPPLALTPRAACWSRMDAGWQQVGLAAAARPLPPPPLAMMLAADAAWRRASWAVRARFSSCGPVGEELGESVVVLAH